ncbi:B- and T-lymphocyte attenuator [Melanotaenia boesemani]|uniref:B- and T-lymphocyte attenuator n=1 Tax=Melanotaenia boesemani TaxID=1250792 RepID=UPI001C04892A|nr:B- and T-lymphocyte attenuator [Melanotaenia boesemani]
MNMSCLMERKLNCLIVWCFTFIYICRGGQDLSTSCDVMLMVRRSTVWRAAPTNHLTVSCPVKDCGKSLNVTWCKVLSNNNCKQINNAEDVEIRQTYEKEGLISYLSFKQVSVHDDGLYRCTLIREDLKVFSNAINISVSDEIQGVEHFSYRAGESPSAAGDEVDWVPYFSICIGLAFLVTILTALTILCFHGWNRKWTSDAVKREEMPIHMIPTLPKRNIPSAPVLQTHFSILNDIYSSAETPTSPPFIIPTEIQHAVTKTAVQSPESDNEVYAVINHSQRGTPALNPHATSKMDKNPAYAVINLP